MPFIALKSEQLSLVMRTPQIHKSYEVWANDKLKLVAQSAHNRKNLRIVVIVILCFGCKGSKNI